MWTKFTIQSLNITNCPLHIGTIVQSGWSAARTVCDDRCKLVKYLWRYSSNFDKLLGGIFGHATYQLRMAASVLSSLVRWVKSFSFVGSISLRLWEWVSSSSSELLNAAWFHSWVFSLASLLLASQLCGFGLAWFSICSWANSSAVLSFWCGLVPVN